MRGLDAVSLLILALSATGGAETAPTPESGQNPWAEPARDVLVQYCGDCHRPGLPTSNPRALAVFNLHEPSWWGTMTPDQLRAMRRRVGQMIKAHDEDRDVVVAFVDCILDGACAPHTEEKLP